ncbi:hypothetical protein Poli38472_014777 [Pythium oligandrum]|uniref:Thaumatin-like protein n=1 Tax=Pythium oligandrum TaxID=41045 RepID=A0A8K1FAF5_PYTOL|nr:hypothetical protein Poli38472_014777 [Pythium oligandrum]|eukprot:TMW55006.1 hypothetical protein Poli38472_014777 [Pythium oligandrum]
MVQLLRSLLVLSALLLAAPASANKIRFFNKCPKEMELQHASGLFSSFKTIAKIPPGGMRTGAITKGSHAFRRAGSTTMAEFTASGSGVVFDISSDPTSGKCSTNECAITTKYGVNITPTTKASGASCRMVTCTKDDKAACAAAYDNFKQACALATDYDITFCPSGTRRLRGDSQ